MFETVGAEYDFITTLTKLFFQETNIELERQKVIKPSAYICYKQICKIEFLLLTYR